jgi:hypothetical protein
LIKCRENSKELDFSSALNLYYSGVRYRCEDVEKSLKIIEGGYNWLNVLKNKL